MTWSIRHVSVDVAAFHAGDLSDERTVDVVDAPGSTVVLGSRQGGELLDVAACRERGVSIASRRSGGGIVYLAEAEYLWIDLVISRDDPLWVDDIRASMRWLGAVWQDALRSVGIRECTVYDGALAGGVLGQLVCFAGVGPGEVIDGSGAKLVGIAQRRSRTHARFQSMVLHRWEPQEIVALLADPDVDVNMLRDCVRAVPVATDTLTAAFVQSLP